MKYKEMMEEAKAKGLTSEKTMWESVAGVEELLCLVKKEHPDMYWHFLRKQHDTIFGGHYGKDFAEHDVKALIYKDVNGEKHEGEHWTMDEVLKASANKTFPTGTTDYDKWVAYNVMYSDLSTELDKDHILKVAYKFFFADDDFDYSHGSKIWKYMCGIKK